MAVPLLGRNGLAAWFDLRRQEHELQQEVQTLAAEKCDAGLQQLEDLANDPATLEKLASPAAQHATSRREGAACRGVTAEICIGNAINRPGFLTAVEAVSIFGPNKLR